jgi:farnesyl diphosphate synthase
MRDGAARFDARLEEIIAACSPAAPARLAAAMRHAVLAGGKRLRPYLVLESAALTGADPAAAEAVAAALEFVHCYSLAHDDLPAMDNDDLRRGKPTVHRAFDEATAILAGDSLLTEAFGLIAEAPGLTAAARLRLIAALARAAGGNGMVGGQMLDLAAEGRFGSAAPLDAAAIITLQGMKTGALIRFGAAAGALMAESPPAGALAALERYGEALGLAFQIRDDLIDAEGDAGTAGKATGKDSAAGKGTFVTLLGLAGARARLAGAGAAGLAALDPFGPAAEPLREVIAFNRDRMA